MPDPLAVAANAIGKEHAAGYRMREALDALTRGVEADDAADRKRLVEQLRRLERLTKYTARWLEGTKGSWAEWPKLPAELETTTHDNPHGPITIEDELIHATSKIEVACNEAAKGMEVYRQLRRERVRLRRATVDARRGRL